MQWKGDKDQPWNKADNSQANPDRNHGYTKEDHLKAMKPHKTALIVWLHDQKNDRRNDCDVGQHAYNIVRHPAGCALHGSGRRCRCTTATCWTHGRAICYLRSTPATKSHRVPSP